MELPSPIRLNKRREVPSDPRRFPALWTPAQTHIWENVVFTVPNSVSDERVQSVMAARYRNKGGEYYEKEGFQVLAVDGPREDRSLVALQTTDPDRRKYVIWYKLRRRPKEQRAEVSDAEAPELLAAGYKLKD